MEIRPSRLKPSGYLRLILLFVVILTLALAGCTAFPTEEDPSLRETQLELNVQQTLAANKATEADVGGTIEAQRATLEAQSAQATRIAQQQPPATATVDEATIQQTEQAQQATLSAEQTALAPTETPIPEPVIDFATWMQSANILVFEDMTTMPETNRYVKDTLGYMQLNFSDTGSAKGMLQTQVAGPGPNGEEWDLLIIAAEAKKEGVNGEFINYIEDALTRGSSVIFETWTLDRLSSGIAGPLLARCGLALDNNWTKVPPSRLVMFALDPTNPILNVPNSGISFSKTTSFWWNPDQNIDVGDWMMLARDPKDAKIVIGSLATETTNHGTVSVCFGGQFILQTFSSHAHSFNALKPLWENYIYNALKVRYDSLMQ